MGTIESVREIHLSRSEAFSETCRRIAVWADRNAVAVVVTMSALYFVVTYALSATKIMWADEFITFHIAKLNSFSAIWGALAQGADPNPPMAHLAEMWAMRLLGESAAAVRTPAILASWMGVVSLYLFIRKRIPALYALSGVAFFVATRGYDYSYESRSYAFMLGFSMLSMLAWRYVAEGPHRNLATVLLALALAGGISSNYFCVLAFFPIAAGELVRTFDRRRFEFRVWLAMAAGAAPMLLFLPLINNAISRFAPHAWNRVRPDFLTDSYTEMFEVILAPALVMIACGVAMRLRDHRLQLVNRPAFPRHEIIAVLVLMAYPFVGYAIASFRGGMISSRFVIPFCFGFAIAVAAAAYRLFGNRVVPQALMLLVCCSWALTRNATTAYDLVSQQLAFKRIVENLPASGGPLVVSESLLVLPLEHYAPRNVARRIVFPLDFEAIRKYKGEDSLEQNFWAGRGVFPIRIVSPATLAKLPDYTVVTTRDNWLLSVLSDRGNTPRQLPINSDSKDIKGFTPLSHGETFFYDVERQESRYEVADIKKPNSMNRRQRARAK